MTGPVAELLTVLGAADQGRLRQLFDIFGEDGRVSLNVATNVLFPDKSHEDALTAFRQFRQRIRESAVQHGIDRELLVSGGPRTPIADRYCWMGSGSDAKDVGRPRPFNTPIHLPYPSIGPLFKGRDAVLAAIHANLTQGSNTAITSAILGMGGVGKTRAAVEYAWTHHASHSATLLISARTAGGLTTALGELTAPLGLPAGQTDAERAAAVVAWLNAHPGWLLILDNADTQEAMQAATALMGRLHGGHVLLTTRLTTLPGAFQRLPLDVLPPEAAADLLLEASAGRRKPAPDDREQALALAQALGGLALAVTHAAAYVAERGMSLERYRTLLATAFDRLLGYSAPTVTQYERSTAATLALSVAELTEQGRTLLELLSFLATAPVPESLLDVPVADGAEADWTEALANLAAYSLVTRDLEAGTFTLHRLVQETTRRALPSDAAQARLTQALGWVNAAFTGDPRDVRDWPRLDPLAEHAEAVALAAREMGIADPTARLMGALGLLFDVKARYDRAERMSRGALALIEATRGKDHPALAASLNNLAQLLKSTNRLAEAEPLMRRALAIDEASYGAQHPEVAIDLNNLASLMYATNRLAEAEVLMRRALAIGEASYGAEHPDVAIRLNNLAALLHDTNRLGEAEPLMRRALAIDEASYGAEHPRVAVHLNNLAQWLQATNRLGEAEPLMRRALAIDEASYGAEHPDVARDLNNLARLLQATNRLGEAEPFMRRALAIVEASYGAEHPDVATNLNNLAWLLYATNRLGEAEPLMRRMVVILLKFQRATGHPHPHRETALDNHADLLRAMGRDEAFIAAEQQAMHREAGLA
jgi:hypothetical protein